MLYKKKPITIEAIQWTGLNLEEIKIFVGASLEYSVMDTTCLDTAWEVEKARPHVFMKIHTPEGAHTCSEGDFIIRGVSGEFSLCKPDIFAETYDLAE